MRNIFVSVTGQDDNLGDSVLRREMLTKLRASNVRLHLHVGGNTKGYLDNLVDYESDRTYRSRRTWYAKMASYKPSSVVIVLNPGERTLSRGQSYLGRYQGALFGNLVKRGADIVQTGVGIRNPTELSGDKTFAVLEKFKTVTWRDCESMEAAGTGQVYPDWALGYVSPRDSSALDSTRKFLAIALRGDRSDPDQSWIRQVEQVCTSTGLTPIVVVQVERDRATADQIAAALSCETTKPWKNTSHAEQERIVREIYAKSAVVISDRLHALIFGITEGALPIAWSPNSTEKCVRTLIAAGFPNPALSTGVSPSVEVERILENPEANRAALHKSQEMLTHLVDQLTKH